MPGSPGNSARREGRDDVTALPYGPSVPHMFIVVFLVMLPTYLKTTDPDPRLAGRPGLGIHHRHHHPAGRLRRADDPQVHPARGDAGRAGRHFDRVHLDAPRRAELAGAVARVHFARHHPGCWCARVRLPWGLPGGLAAVLVVPCWPGSPPHGTQPGDGPACRRPRARQIRPACADTVGRLPGRPFRYRPAAGRRRAAWHLQFHRGHEQRRKRLRRGRQFRPAQGAAGRRHRRAGRSGAWLAIPAGRVYRSSRLEIRRRPRRLFAGHRRRHRAGVLPGPDRAAARRGAAGRRSCPYFCISAW